MKRMLINATQSEERRLAIVNGQKLLDFETEIEGREQRKGNIYKAVVKSIEPSLEACFVDYGEDRNGFLPFKEISRNYFREGVEVRSARIQDAIREGDQLLVQVEKEERGNKGAALTTFVSLAGRYLVLMPNNPRGGGVSRRIEGEEREELKENLDQLQYPNGMSLIARTAGIGRSAVELQWDLDYMLTLWKAIDSASQAGKGAFLIYQESSLVIRAIRDYFTLDVGEILIDDDDLFEQAQQFMHHVMPDSAPKVKRYRDDAPLFSRFQIEHQIETAFSRTVNLPSGGAIVIDHTEALVSVDVNSARATRGSDIEETATRTNLEAADEIARQMRLRDLGGLIVVDFIDMEEAKNRRDVENRLRDALRQDRARVQFSTISKFGLLELSRQRLRPALSEGSHVTCPRCNGTGHIRDTESSALQILRMVQEEAMKENTVAVHVQVPVDVTSFLLNEKRTEIAKIEIKQRVRVLLIPNKHLDTPNYRLERLRHDDPRLEGQPTSYSMIEEPQEDLDITRREKFKAKQEPVIKGILPDTQAPPAPPRPARRDALAATPAAQAAAVSLAAHVPASTGGFFGWIKNLLGGAEPEVAAAPTLVPPVAAPGERGERNDRGRGGRGERGGRGSRESRPEGAERGERGQGRNPRRSDAPQDAPAALAPSSSPRRGRQTEPRAEAVGTEVMPQEVAADGRRGNRRGPRTEREPRPGLELATNEERAFVDTIPGADLPDALDAVNAETGERTGRRRNRRGGRGGRDRDDAAPRGGAADLAAPAQPQHAVGTDPAPASVADPEAVSAALANTAEFADFTAGPNAEPRRRSRGRGGRGERQRREEAGEFSAAEPGSGSDVVPVDAPLAAAVLSLVAAPPSAIVAPSAAPAAVPVVVPALQAATTSPSPSPALTSKPTASAQPYVLPTHALQAVAEQGGMQWVVSDTQKIRAAQEAMAKEPKPIHIPREIKPAQDVDHGPLVMVETSRDLAKIKLPFEAT
jgi:ribonuclease E